MLRYFIFKFSIVLSFIDRLINKKQIQVDRVCKSHGDTQLFVFIYKIFCLNKHPGYISRKEEVETFHCRVTLTWPNIRSWEN